MDSLNFSYYAGLMLTGNSVWVLINPNPDFKLKYERQETQNEEP